MKRKIAALGLAFLLFVSAAPQALGIQLAVDGQAISIGNKVIDSTTYVSLRQMVGYLDSSASVSWKDDQASAEGSGFTLTVSPNEYWLICNGHYLYIPGGVKVINGLIMVPVRVLAKALGATVTWDASSGVTVTSGSSPLSASEPVYDSASVYWLSRIIEAESVGEPLKGKIAVGTVVLNRVASSEFPDTIYDVIFDSSYGGQFEPVKNGTINWDPTEESTIAAKLCLEGARVASESLYFFNPSKSDSTWFADNCTYVATIGSHIFYK
ncbi:hypothetical protein SDC9_100621 [bioreactor metagenome]|uniref:Spore cortex-lytic enzyme n=1 Tax=bioreactor metagenome TaxID=1076179 RepID=A0A645ANI1_9ZZZZ